MNNSAPHHYHYQEFVLCWLYEIRKTMYCV